MFGITTRSTAVAVFTRLIILQLAVGLLILVVVHFYTSKLDLIPRFMLPSEILAGQQKQQLLQVQLGYNELEQQVQQLKQQISLQQLQQSIEGTKKKEPDEQQLLEPVLQQHQQYQLQQLKQHIYQQQLDNNEVRKQQRQGQLVEPALQHQLQSQHEESQQRLVNADQQERIQQLQRRHWQQTNIVEASEKLVEKLQVEKLLRLVRHTVEQQQTENKQTLDSDQLRIDEHEIEKQEKLLTVEWKKNMSNNEVQNSTISDRSFCQPVPMCNVINISISQRIQERNSSDLRQGQNRSKLGQNQDNLDLGQVQNGSESDRSQNNSRLGQGRNRSDGETPEYKLLTLFTTWAPTTRSKLQVRINTLQTWAKYGSDVQLILYSDFLPKLRQDQIHSIVMKVDNDTDSNRRTDDTINRSISNSSIGISNQAIDEYLPLILSPNGKIKVPFSGNEANEAILGYIVENNGTLNNQTRPRLLENKKRNNSTRRNKKNKPRRAAQPDGEEIVEAKVIELARILGWSVRPCPRLSQYGAPILKDMFRDAMDSDPSYFYGYANGDILFATNFLDTLNFLRDQILRNKGGQALERKKRGSSVVRGRNSEAGNTEGKSEVRNAKRMEGLDIKSLGQDGQGQSKIQQLKVNQHQRKTQQENVERQAKQKQNGKEKEQEIQEQRAKLQKGNIKSRTLQELIQDKLVKMSQNFRQQLQDVQMQKVNAQKQQLQSHQQKQRPERQRLQRQQLQSQETRSYPNPTQQQQNPLGINDTDSFLDNVRKTVLKWNNQLRQLPSTVVEPYTFEAGVLIIGERSNFYVTDWKSGFKRNVSSAEQVVNMTEGGLSVFGPYAIDYFIMTKNGYPLHEVPDFVVGRSGYDNWLVINALVRGIPVIDITRTALAIHQTDKDGNEAWKERIDTTAERDHNINLAGGKSFLFDLGRTSCATYETTMPNWTRATMGDRAPSKLEIKRRARWRGCHRDLKTFMKEMCCMDNNNNSNKNDDNN